MSQKTKKHGKQPSATDLFQSAQRAMEKQDFKEALKSAKLCYRQDQAHDHRQMLERAWLARGMQLAHCGLTDEAQAVARELLELGVSEPTVERNLPNLLLAVGLYDHAAGRGKLLPAVGEPDARFLANAADRAVVDPTTAPASLSGIRQGAENVRLALDALHAGEESAAALMIVNISRQSPFADWKFFVRGLAAYYRDDPETMRGNWDRLDPERIGFRIAASLRRLADPASATTPECEEFRQAVRILEKDILGGPIVWYLESLQRSLLDDRWREAIYGVRRWKKDFETAVPSMSGRLDRLFYQHVLSKFSPQRLEELATAIDPPSWDLNWNRARAIVWEQADGPNFTEGENSIHKSEYYWREYIKDLAEISEFSVADRTLAEAMIWLRIGGNLAAETLHAKSGWGDRYFDDDCDCEACTRERAAAAARASAPTPAESETPQDRARAIEALDRAIAAAPTYAPAYRRLAKAHLDWNQRDAAADVYRSMLHHIPNELEAILFLFKHSLPRDAAAARDYAIEARRIKPASDDVLDMLARGRMAAARAMALQGRYDEARAELAAIQAAGRGPEIPACDATAHAAMIAFKSGDESAGREAVARTLKESDDSADALLCLAIEAVRYDLPNQLEGVRNELFTRWSSSLSKHRGKAIGLMARRMLGILKDEVEFSEKENYLDRVLAYIRAATGIRWTDEDLRDACRLLFHVHSDDKSIDCRESLSKLADSGRKKFPQEPYFHIVRGDLEMERGPRACNRILARNCYTAAKVAAGKSTRPDAQGFLETVQKRLEILGVPGLLSSMFPFGGASGFDMDPSHDSSQRARTKQMLELIRAECEGCGLDAEKMIERIKSKFDLPEVDER